jgi:hypothetical protein
LILGKDLRAFEVGDPRWMTYQQAQEKKWQVRKGEKSTGIFFFKPLEVEDRVGGRQNGEDGPASRMVAVLRSYSVFHASQIDGIPPYKAPTVEEAYGQRNHVLPARRERLTIGQARASCRASLPGDQPLPLFRSPGDAPMGRVARLQPGSGDRQACVHSVAVSVRRRGRGPRLRDAGSDPWQPCRPIPRRRRLSVSRPLNGERQRQEVEAEAGSEGHLDPDQNRGIRAPEE